MIRGLLLASAFAGMVLAGCGGNEGYGCAAQVERLPRAAYAGRYAASFTPTGSSAATATFNLNVEADGLVTGTATVAEGETNVSGRAGDIQYGCTARNLDSGLDLSYPANATDGFFLNVTKRRDGSLVGSYAGTAGNMASRTSGTLVVTRVTQG